MKILITAGSTRSPIDKVRFLSNPFNGKTGTAIAYALSAAGHEVTLVTSNIKIFEAGQAPAAKIIWFKTYDELYQIMEDEIKNGNYGAIVHSAAVSDYRITGTYADNPNTGNPSDKLDDTGMIGSDHEVLWLRMVPTVKIVRQIRGWGFGGTLIMFKLQVRNSDTHVMTHAELFEVASASGAKAEADFIIANFLEDSDKEAFLITCSGEVHPITRDEIGPRIVGILHHE